MALTLLTAVGIIFHGGGPVLPAGLRALRRTGLRSVSALHHVRLPRPDGGRGAHGLPVRQVQRQVGVRPRRPSWSSCPTWASHSTRPSECYWVAGFVIGLGLVCIEFTMTAGILSRWFHTNYGTVTGIVFAMTGVGGVVLEHRRAVRARPGACGLAHALPHLRRGDGDRHLCRSSRSSSSAPRRSAERCPMACRLTPRRRPPSSRRRRGRPPRSAGFRAKEVLKMPFFWTLLLGRGPSEHHHHHVAALCHLRAVPWPRRLGRTGARGTAFALGHP